VCSTKVAPRRDPGLGRNAGRIETLFFPKHYQPPLPHEYQLDLLTEAARETLEWAVGFLNAYSGEPAAGAK
jgi:hypothetical protein